MCYAIPGRIVELKGNVAVVDYFGERRNVLRGFAGFRTGDYVYAQGGIIVDRIPEKEALEILDSWKDLFPELKMHDARLARIRTKAPSGDLPRLLRKAGSGKGMSREELLQLLRLEGRNELRLLYETANSIRQRHHGNACCVHGIIEFSNHCRRGCHYCGIRGESRIERYRMDVDEIIRAAEYSAKALGFRALVLQSGEDLWYDEEKLVRIVEGISGLGVLVFLSIGDRDRRTYDRLYRAGARAALLRFETSNREIFERLRPGTGLDERLRLIGYLKSKGYITATGFLVGLPGETDNDIINNIMLTKSLKADMYSFGPFIPAENTPLEKETHVSRDRALKAIALARLIDRHAKILVTTALEALDRGAKKEGLMAGANSLMIDVTPAEYREKYVIYPGRPGADTEIEESIKETTGLLHSIGRAPTDLGI